MTEADLTRLLAITGAITGIAAFGWQVFTWWRSGKVSLTINVNPGVHYQNLKDELPHTKVVVDNVGQVQTTIHRVTIEVYEGRIWKRLSAVFRQFTNNLMPLPIPLPPGMSWSGTLGANSDDAFDLQPDGIPWVSVYHSHSKKPTKVLLPRTILATKEIPESAEE